MLETMRRLGSSALKVSQEDILAFFTSEIAIIIYVFVILAIIAVLAISVIFSQRKNNEDDEFEDASVAEAAPEKEVSVKDDPVTERFCR